MEDNLTAKGLYSRWEAARLPFLSRAWDAAELTIPALLPRSGHSGSSDLPTPFQGIGARGVNNLASKMLLALFPPNSPFFRLQIDDFTLEKLTQQEGMRAQVEEGLNKIERAVQSEVESSAIRVSAFEALKHLITTGNVLLYLPKGGGMKVYHLDRYVCKRDPMGNVLHLVVKETVAIETLPEEVRSLAGVEEDSTKDKDLEIFTHIYRDDNKWRVYQEVKGIKIPSTVGTYPLDKSPWIAVRWTKIDSEDYGRGYVEEYIGDLSSLEGLTQAIVEGSAAASKVLFFVNPNGLTSARKVAESDNGAVIEGMETDVSVLQMQKFNDFRIAFETIQQISERLSFAFLLNSAIQRKGERVTAEEIRYMANELEDALGGIYSILSQELQLPLVRRLMTQMEASGRLPVLPEKTVKPVIVTGLEALGRGHDLNKLAAFMQQISALGPEVIQTYVNVSDYLTRVGTGLGIDTKGLIKSQEEVQMMQQQQMQMQMMQQGMGPMIQAGGRIAEKSMEQESAPPQN